MARFEGRTRGNCVLFLAAQREPSPDLAHEWGYEQWASKPKLGRWNGNATEPYGPVKSQNFRPPFEAAAGNTEFFFENGGLLDTWKKHGFFGREFGSELYTAPVFNSALLAYRSTANDKHREKFERFAKVFFGLFALTARDTPIKRRDSHIGSDPPTINVKTVNQHYYSGLNLGLAGDRQNASVLDQKTLGPILTLGLDWYPRMHKRFERWPTLPVRPPEGGQLVLAAGGAEDQPGDVVSTDDWHFKVENHISTTAAIVDPLNVAENFHSGFGAGATNFGIDHHIGHTIRNAAIQQPEAIAEVVRWLQAWGVRVHPLYNQFEIWIGELETASLLKGNGSRSKPQWPASKISADGIYSVIQPSEWRPTGATRPDTTIDLSTLLLKSTADGNTCQIRLPRPSIARIVIDSKGTKVVGENAVSRILSRQTVTVPPPPHIPVAEPVPPKKYKRSKKRLLVAAAVLAIGGILLWVLL